MCEHDDQRREVENNQKRQDSCHEGLRVGKGALQCFPAPQRKQLKHSDIRFAPPGNMCVVCRRYYNIVQLLQHYELSWLDLHSGGLQDVNKQAGSDKSAILEDASAKLDSRVYCKEYEEYNKRA